MDVADALARGRYDTVLKLLAEVAQRDVDWHVQMAAALIGKRNAAQAYEHLRCALELSPDHLGALFQLGRAHLLAMDAYNAVALFERLAKLVPDDASVIDNLISAYRRDARYEDAVALADHALAKGRHSEDVFYERAVSLHHLGDPAGALASYDALLTHYPDHAAGWFGSHAPALAVQGADAAIARLRRAVSCKAANSRYWAFLCVYARLLGRAEEAAQIFADKIAQHPKRRPLVDSIEALLPHLSPSARLFSVSADVLRFALAQAKLEDAEGEGMVLEFGVRRGASINVLAAATGQTVHGFDSFEGLPEAWGNEPRGVLTTGAELPPVRDNVTLHPGWFEQTLPEFLAGHPGPVRFVNVDSDIYSSAKTVLTGLAARFRPGTVLVFDEFIGNRHWRDDEFKAFAEYAAENDVGFDYIAVSPFTKQVAVRLTRIGEESVGPLAPIGKDKDCASQMQIEIHVVV